jgi:NAD(P)H-dependent flavin oxidoreductase YrpB (nitropropane dioxygenase family)
MGGPGTPTTVARGLGSIAPLPHYSLPQMLSDTPSKTLPEHQGGMPMAASVHDARGPRLHTPLCDLLGITHPIVLGGMASGTAAPLVAAVSNAGGLGTLGASGRSPAEVREQTARIRELTAAPFGLNILLFLHEEATLQAVLEQRPAVAAFAWPHADQDLAEVFRRAHDAGALVMHMASRLDEAARAAEAGADVIVAQGSEGGGHVGVMGTMVLVPQVVAAVAPKPVLAAGGIADGRGLAAALALGAEGVLLGTRFLATREAPLHDNFKQAIVASDGHDTDLTEIPDLITGRVWPGAFARTWRNALLREWAGREWQVRQRRSLIADAVAAARAAGDAERTPLLFGQDAGLIDSIEPVAEVMTRMVREAHELINGRLARLASPPESLSAT